MHDVLEPVQQLLSREERLKNHNSSITIVMIPCGMNRWVYYVEVTQKIIQSGERIL